MKNLEVHLISLLLGYIFPRLFWAFIVSNNKVNGMTLVYIQQIDFSIQKIS